MIADDVSPYLLWFHEKVSKNILSRKVIQPFTPTPKDHTEDIPNHQQIAPKEITTAKRQSTGENTIHLTPKTPVHVLKYATNKKVNQADCISICAAKNMQSETPIPKGGEYVLTPLAASPYHFRIRKRRLLLD